LRINGKVEIKISVLIEGGKASGGAALGPKIGPLGIDIKKVVDGINEKTKDFAGITVPVDVYVDKEKKTFRIEVGTPPTASLIKRELGIEKRKEVVEEVKMEEEKGEKKEKGEKEEEKGEEKEKKEEEKGIEKKGEKEEEKGMPALNISLEKVIKVAKIKKDSMNVKDLRAAVLSVLGTCMSLKITCEGKSPKEVIKEIKLGEYEIK